MECQRKKTCILIKDCWKKKIKQFFTFFIPTKRRKFRGYLRAEIFAYQKKRNLGHKLSRIEGKVLFSCVCVLFSCEKFHEFQGRALILL